jgi:hypothetical protein
MGEKFTQPVTWSLLTGIASFESWLNGQGDSLIENEVQHGECRVENPEADRRK